jgi:argininosuccinate lyase
MGRDIAAGSYIPKRELDHNHQGSIGNLQLEAIRKKMKTLTD